MLNCEDLEFSLKGVSVAAWQNTMSRQGNRSCCNSAIQSTILPKLIRFDKSPGLNISKGQYSIIILAPPAGNRKVLFYTNINMQSPNWTKLHIFGKTHTLKTPIGQYSVIIIAPPLGNRLSHAYTTQTTMFNLHQTSYVWLKCFPEDIYMPISTYSHSATSWQQEVWHIKWFDIFLLYFPV